MGHNFKEKSVFNIDRVKFEENYDKIFGNKKDKTVEIKKEMITITKKEYNELLEIKKIYEGLCK